MQQNRDRRVFDALAVMLIAALAAAGGAACKKKGEESGGGTASPPPTAAPAPAPAAAPSPSLEAPAPSLAAAPEPGAVTLKNAPTADETKAADALALKLADDNQRGAETVKTENARLFLVLAARKGELPVVAAALEGLVQTWGDTNMGEPALDEDYRAVIAARLSATEHEILVSALSGAQAAIHAAEPVGDSGERPADPAIVAGLLGLIRRADDPAAQYEALRTLHYAANVLETPEGQEAFLAAFASPHPHVAAEALVEWKWLGHGAPSRDDIPGEQAYRSAIQDLLQHGDPAVRGEACAALVEFWPYGDEEAAKPLAKLLLPLLEDQHPLVVSRAAYALAALNFKPAIHAIVKHLDDTRANTYDTPGWTNLRGGAATDSHDGSAWSRVDDAMLSALESMTFHDEVKFDYDVSGDTMAADLAKAVEAAKAWYEAHQAEVPPLEEHR